MSGRSVVIRLPGTVRRAGGVVVVCLAALSVLVVGASFFMPVGPRAGVILDAPMVDSATRIGLTRGVLCYRREAPPLMGGQVLAWEPTLMGPDPFGPWHRDVSWWRVTWGSRNRPASVSEAHVPVWPLVIVVTAFAGAVVRGWVKGARRRARDECVRCGYPLVSGRCAECGWAEVG